MDEDTLAHITDPTPPLNDDDPVIGRDLKLPEDGAPPAAEPDDVEGKNLPPDHQALETNLDTHEVYDEGAGNTGIDLGGQDILGPAPPTDNDIEKVA